MNDRNVVLSITCNGLTITLYNTDIVVLLLLSAAGILYARVRRVRRLGQVRASTLPHNAPGPAESASHAVDLSLSEKAPKPLRYGSDKLEGGAWDATGPGYLPDPDPLNDFDLRTARLRDYVYVNKVLRYPYFQTMAHQPMHINDWIEIDKDYEWYLSEKARVIREQGKVVIDSLPENDAACTELLETLVDYLPKRFPTLFEPIASHQSGSPYSGILNKVTGESFSDVHKLKGVDALLVVSRLVPDDFLMAREREDGKIYLVGGLIVFPGSYLLSEKINQPLHVLHGEVPHFNKMLMSVERTMKRFAPDRPFERSSWMIVDDRELFWHNIISGTMHKDIFPGDLFLRIDHQTFRKLPKTRGIMFGVHPVLTRMEDLANSPLVPALLGKIHSESDRSMMDYKKSDKYTGVLIPYLQKLTEQQLAKGLVRREDIDECAKFRERANITT